MTLGKKVDPLGPKEDDPVSLSRLGLQAVSSSKPKVRKAKKSVLIADYLADRLITLGGAGVLAAVLGILVFLVEEVIPLFEAAKIEESQRYVLKMDEAPLLLALDEQGALAYGLRRDGGLFVFHGPTGVVLQQQTWDWEKRKLTSWCFSQDKTKLALGFSDGTVRIGQIEVFSELVSRADLASLNLRELPNGDFTNGEAVFRAVSNEEFRMLRLRASLGEPRLISEDQRPLVILDFRAGGTEERSFSAVAGLDDGGKVWVEKTEYKRNLLTGQMREITQVRSFESPVGREEGPYLLLGAQGEMVYLIARKGDLFRFDVSKPEGSELVEVSRLSPEGVEITGASFLAGERSLILGGSDGSVNVWFLVEGSQTRTGDGRTMVLARSLPPHESAVCGIEPGMRGKVFATWDKKGEVWVRHATSEKTLGKMKPTEAPDVCAALSPRVDAAVAISASSGAGSFLRFFAPHPETSFRTLFGKVWYEGRSGPEYVWQSSGGTEDFEPKMSLVPLIFGTLKGTFYALLFAVPIALGAAIYTSEFLSPGVRDSIKPAMELMASLPSVILGFVAALVLAPVVETWIAAVLLAFLVVPLGLLLAGFSFQLIPEHIGRRLGLAGKLLLMALVLGFCLWISIQGGDVFERVFFAGDFKAWLSGGPSGRVSPLVFFMLPVGLTVSTLSLGRRGLCKEGGPWSQLTKVSLVLILGIASSYGIAWGFENAGFDLRGGLLGTYVQRNTLVVAFAMGFAVIPLIYTLAEEALRAVPDHLRAASLSCGATPWQTTMWIVLPTAASGIFSAIMIGMGRAVGETMIVVMATGNTPIIDLNPFNGFRALSANIAVELPEAVRGGTLYRVLFFTALVLFSMTFIINTVAELIRLRFRRRSQQL